MNSDKLKMEFDREIENDMETSRLLFKKCHGRFFPMLRRHGGVVTAKRLLAASKPQDWVAEMILAGRPDLTIEAKALKRKYRPLFTEKEIEAANDRIGDAVKRWLKQRHN
jgi:hypothetical protein